MSVLTYNGVTLPHGLTTEFSQEAVSDDSGTDHALTRLVIRVQSLVNVNYLSVIYPPLANLNAANVQTAPDVMVLLRKRLLTRRRALSFKVGNTEMVPLKAGANTGTVDAANGPTPQRCDVFQLTADTFLIDYRIEAHYWENVNRTAAGGQPNVNRAGGPILNCRWTESVTVDRTLLSTYTRSGVIRLRSDNSDGLTVDNYRDTFAVLGVRSGFVRAESHYEITSDGLYLKFQHKDEEQWKMPPRPAYEAAGEYIESARPGSNGNVRIGAARCALRASKNVPQGELIQVAVATCLEKLALNRLQIFRQGGGFFFPELRRTLIAKLVNAAVKVDMYKNEVECQLAAWLANRVGRQGGIPGEIDEGMTTTPYTEVLTVGQQDPNAPSFPLRGTADIFIQAAAYYDPDIANMRVDPVRGVLTSSRTHRLVGQAGLQPETVLDQFN